MHDPDPDPARLRVAVVSLLFNWPSSGGGNVHTWELARELSRAGYDVRHFYASYPGWAIGLVREALPYPADALEFDEATWHAGAIQDRFRTEVAAFGPDCVIVTDSWNFKPLLAEAVQDYPYLLRMQALECLCPLNNLRFIIDDDGAVTQCDQLQMATPDACGACVASRGHRSGPLHRGERELSGFGGPAYEPRLRRAFGNAAAVLVVNPLHAAMVRPFVRDVRVVTSGFDAARFPWPDESAPARADDGRVRLLFAGLTGEFFKGFHVLREACDALRAVRHDFELVATSDPPGRVNDVLSFTGWLAQDELAREMRTADIVVLPTIGQDALGRTAVEAMGAGKPVVASRIGGLPFTVTDGVTGLLVEPGESGDLARAVEVLLDNAWLRKAMGRAGRRRFEQDFTWDVVIDRHYRPLLAASAAVGAGR